MISGVVKISVALVLYRLDSRPKVKTIIIIDIVTCTIWNVVTTLVLSLGCMRQSPYVISNKVCENTFYSQESSYVIYDVFHVLLPIYILWNVQISRALKVSVVCLFSVGLLLVNPISFVHAATCYHSQEARENSQCLALTKAIATVPQSPPS